MLKDIHIHSCSAKHVDSSLGINVQLELAKVSVEINQIIVKLRELKSEVDCRNRKFRERISDSSIQHNRAEVEGRTHDMSIWQERFAEQTNLLDAGQIQSGIIDGLIQTLDLLQFVAVTPAESELTQTLINEVKSLSPDDILGFLVSKFGMDVFGEEEEAAQEAEQPTDAPQAEAAAPAATPAAAPVTA